MKKELTFKDMASCLKTRRGKAYYFRFPNCSNTLILDYADQISDEEFKPKDKEFKRLLFEHAWFEYRKYMNFSIGI